MRTTIDIEDELLLTVKEMAKQRRISAGAVVSDMLRDSLRPKNFKTEYRNGVPLLPKTPNGPAVTMALVNRLRDEDF